MTIRSITVPIEDFGCAGSGALIVERALIKVPGVLRVYVNASTEMAYVQYDAEYCTVVDLTDAIVRAGFHASEPIVM
ncbi:MAG: cation transporter [Nitrososphaerota archaeon]